MPPRNYKIADWGPPVGEGVSDSRIVSVSGVAKTYSDAEPHIVANEVVCARLAAVAGLPIPPGFTVEFEAKPWFVSLNFNLSGEPLPPVRARDLLDRDPVLCAGILLFDIWVLNPDRHNRNVALDRTSGRCEIFDHSRALMPLDRPAREFAAANEDDIAIDAGNHFLQKEIQDPAGFGHWFHRFHSIPEFQIRDALDAAVGIGLPPEHTDFFADFLIRRRAKLPTLIEHHRAKFPALDLGLGGPIAWS